MELAVLEVREEHTTCGGRTLRKILHNSGYGYVPSPSAITAILRRNDRLATGERAPHHWQRFEHAQPNDLWQMDFKGHFPTGAGRCHPLTVLDDHSRFALGVQACADERTETVRECLSAVFRVSGLPEWMLMDNGSPWRNDRRAPALPADRLAHASRHTGEPRTAVSPANARQGGERFHRTLKAEVLQGRHFADLLSCQEAFDRWRGVYNRERPHQALDLATPISRYAPSPRSFPETLPPIEYGEGDLVRKVMAEGWVSFKGREFKVGRALRGGPVALRPTASDGVWGVWFMAHPIAEVDLRGPSLEVRRSPDV